MAEHFELGQRHVAGDLDRVETVVPLVADITHGVTDWKGGLGKEGERQVQDESVPMTSNISVHEIYSQLSISM